MKKIFLIASILVGFISNAQVAVGTVKDGVLIPFSPAATTVNDNAITTSKIADAQVSEAKIDGTLAAKINGKAEASDVTTLESEVADKATKTELEEANALNRGYITASKTLTVNDLGTIQKKTNSSVATVTIPASTYSNDGVISFLNFNDSGKLIVQGESGVTLDRLQLTGKGSFGTISRDGANNWDYFKGDFIPYVNPNPEVYPNLNAFAKNTNTNSTSGMSVSGVDMSIIDDTAGATGVYYLRGISNNLVNSARIFEGVVVTNATTYDYELWARATTGTVGARFEMSAITVPINFGLTESWVQFKGTFTTTGTALNMQFNTNRNDLGGVAGSLGDGVEVRGFSLKLAE